MVFVLVLVLLGFAASDGSRGKQLGAAAVEAGVKACGPKRENKCCGDGKCNGPEDEITCMADCPGVQTAQVCHRHPPRSANKEWVAWMVRLRML